MRSLALLLVLLAGCGGLDAFTFSPHEGLWKVTDGEVVDDQCGVLSADALSADFDEIWLDVGQPTQEFDIWVDESDVTPCDQRGDSFFCDPALMDRNPREDVTISRALATEGWFDSPMDMSGDFTLAVDCHGGGCGGFVTTHGLSGFPCTVTGAFDAQAVRGVTLEDRR